MKTRSVLLYVGIVLMVVGSTRLSMQLGFSGLNSSWCAMFAMGLLLVAHEPARQLSKRVQSLEAQLARSRGDSKVARD